MVLGDVRDPLSYLRHLVRLQKGAKWSDQLYRPGAAARPARHHAGHEADLRRGNSESRKSRQAPMTIEESAKLKSGQ